MKIFGSIRSRRSSQHVDPDVASNSKCRAQKEEGCRLVGEARNREKLRSRQGLGKATVGHRGPALGSLCWLIRTQMHFQSCFLKLLAVMSNNLL